MENLIVHSSLRAVQQDAILSSKRRSISPQLINSQFSIINSKIPLIKLLIRYMFNSLKYIGERPYSSYIFWIIIHMKNTKPIFSNVLDLPWFI